MHQGVPLMVARDFNYVIGPLDKKGGKAFLEKILSIPLFWLIGLGFVGSWFT